MYLYQETDYDTYNFSIRFLKKNAEVEDDEEKVKNRMKRREERRETRVGKSSKRDQPDDGGEWETVRKGAATSDKPKMFAKVCYDYRFLLNHLDLNSRFLHNIIYCVLILFVQKL